MIIMKLPSIKKNRTLEIITHIIFWSLFFVLPLFMNQRESTDINWKRFAIDSIVPLSSFTIFYLNYLIFVPQLLFKDKKRLFFLLNVISISILVMGMHLWHELMFYDIMKPPRVHKIVFYTRDSIMMIFTAGLSVALRMSKRMNVLEASRREAIKSKMEAELKNLRNQLNPHFLLNTLNNIYALTVFNPEQAQTAIQELSRLLRYVLYDNQETQVPLCKEIEFIRNYISLMRIRIPERVRIETHFNVADDDRTPIAPLIFISLIENAFKHGISPSENSFISISFNKNGDTITCAIENSNHPKKDTDKSGSGIGLRQVQQRLDITYPGQYEWNTAVSEDNTVYSSILKINLNQENRRQKNETQLRNNR